MFDQEHLILRLIRLKSPEIWSNKQQGFSFLFLKGGVAKYIVGPVEQRLVSGDVAVLNGAARGQLHVLSGGEVMFWCFSLCLEHLFPLFTGDEISLLHSITEGFRDLKLYPASSSLAKEGHLLVGDVSPQFSLNHRVQLLRVAAAVLSEEFRTAHGQRVGFVRANDHMIQVFESLSADQLLSLSVGKLAGRFSISRRHLNRLFHQHFGVSAAVLRMEMRLLRAVSLLRDPDAKIINVAEQCGFNHLGLFNTCFKRRFGLSPGRWRKQVLQGGERPAGLLQADSGCPLHANGLCPWTGKTQDSARISSEAVQRRKLSPPRAVRIARAPVPENAGKLAVVVRQPVGEAASPGGARQGCA